MKSIKCLIVVMLLTLINARVSAQIAVGSYSGGGGTPAITTLAQVNAGLSTNNYIAFTIGNLPFGTSIPAGWTLRIRANGNFINGASSIPSQFVSLRYKSVVQGTGGISGGAVPLTNTDANLISTANPLNAPNDYYNAQLYDMIIQGGSHLLVGNTGTFSTTLTLSLYNNVGTLIATNTNIPISFNVTYTNSCSGASLGSSGGPQYNFDTYAKILAGGTAANAAEVQYSPGASTCSGWSLKVRANGNFVNGGSSIPPQYVSLRFNSLTGSPSAGAIGITNTPVPLSLTDVALINNSNAPFTAYGYTVHKFDMIIQGGNHLLLGTASGTYTCNITFSLYNQSGVLVSSTNMDLKFQISYANSTSYTVTMANPNVDFNYNNPAAFASGLSITKPNGLRIVGYTPYQVIVKTSGSTLINGANTIPVSVVRLETSPPVSPSGINGSTVSLSASDQIIITNPMPNSNYHTIDYNLRYYIPGNTSAVSGAAPGTYTTQVIYVVLPQ